MGKFFIFLLIVLLMIGVEFEQYYLFWWCKWILLLVPFTYTMMMVSALYFIVAAVSNANLKKMRPDYKTLGLHVFLVIDGTLIQILMYISYNHVWNAFIFCEEHHWLSANCRHGIRGALESTYKYKISYMIGLAL